MTVVPLALAAAASYGAADFCGGLASRRSSSLAVVVWSQAAGLLVLIPALFVIGGTARAADLGWGLACGLAGAFAIALLYRGLAAGTMGVVSPITAVLAAAIPVIFAAVRGERPAPLAGAGIACALVAVVLVSASGRADAGGSTPAVRPRARRRLPPGVAEALGAGAAFGFFFIALAQTRADAGLVPLLATRLSSIALLAAGALLLRRPVALARPALPTVAAAGLLDMGANVLYVLAVHAGALSIAAVLTSLYPAATVALAAVILRERLGAVQWIGVGAAFTGVACIALAR